MNLPILFLTLSLLLLNCLPVSGDDFADSPEFAHAMDIRTETIDGFPVVTQHGQIRPDFSDREPNPHRDRILLTGQDWWFRFDSRNEGRVQGTPVVTSY